MRHLPRITQRTGLRVGVAVAVCALAWTAGCLRAQDNSSPAPPPPDSGPSTPPTDTTGPIPDASTDQDNVSFQTFYDALASQGSWVQSSDYGYVWQPSVTDPNWAPYTVGHWAYTDAGWTWVSDEDWGWATYHYGRWVNLDGYGWCWVPGYTWAPAWVSWRYGDDYCGWAPLPPDSFVGIDYGESDDAVITTGFHIGGDCDGYYGIGAGWYCFIPVRCLGHRHYHDDYCNRFDNDRIINRTKNVTNIIVAGPHPPMDGHGGIGDRAIGLHRVTTGGPTLTQVNAVGDTPLTMLKLARSPQPGGGTLANNSLLVYAPRLDPDASRNSHPQQLSGTLGPSKINRGTDLTQPLIVNRNLPPNTATEEQVQQARWAQRDAPAGAKVVTAVTTVTPVLRAPLASLPPMPQPPVEHGTNRSPTMPPASISGGTPPNYNHSVRSIDYPAATPEHLYPAPPVPGYPAPPGTIYQSPNHAPTPTTPQPVTQAPHYQSSDRVAPTTSTSGGGGTSTTTSSGNSSGFQGGSSSGTGNGGGSSGGGSGWHH